jgi:hypothetical protein
MVSAAAQFTLLADKLVGDNNIDLQAIVECWGIALRLARPYSEQQPCIRCNICPVS